MSLKQNNEKIKSIIQVLIIFELIIIVYLFTYIYSVYNRGDDIVFQDSYFAVNFLSESKITHNNYEIDTHIEDNFYIVASVNGARYYYRGCPGIGRINLENRVYFDSEKEAEDAGYTLARNCQK